MSEEPGVFKNFALSMTFKIFTEATKNVLENINCNIPSPSKDTSSAYTSDSMSLFICHSVDQGFLNIHSK